MSANTMRHPPLILATGGLSSLLCDDADDVLNTGGKTDFLNMLERERLADKKTSKTEAVTSMIPAQLLHNPEWKTYLSARYVLTRQLAEQTRERVDAETPCLGSTRVRSTTSGCGGPRTAPPTATYGRPAQPATARPNATPNATSTTGWKPSQRTIRAPLRHAQ
jgi:hypothetical protein